MALLCINQILMLPTYEPLTLRKLTISIPTQVSGYAYGYSYNAPRSDPTQGYLKKLHTSTQITAKQEAQDHTSTLQTKKA